MLICSPSALLPLSLSQASSLPRISITQVSSPLSASPPATVCLIGSMAVLDCSNNFPPIHHSSLLEGHTCQSRSKFLAQIAVPYTLTVTDETDQFTLFFLFLSHSLCLDGGPKLRGWTNGGMQDHQSTLSRPRSAEVITANGNGTLPNGRHMNGVLTRGPGGLHEDLEFPPTPRTLSKKKQIVWMRPHVSGLSVRCDGIPLTLKRFVYASLYCIP